MLLSGAIVAGLEWRWVFAPPVLVAAVALSWVVKLVPGVQSARGTRPGYSSSALLMVGLATVTHGLLAIANDLQATRGLVFVLLGLLAPNAKGMRMMSGRFDGKVALVTGGGSGIGRETAIAFAREGAAVIVAGRRSETVEETAELIRRAGGRAQAFAANVTDSADVARLIDEIASRWGRLDTAFNNAGILGAPGPMSELDHREWTEVLDTNLTGVWTCMTYEIRYMRELGGGAVINMAANIGAHMTSPNLGAYTASKAAVSAITRVAALENIQHGIRINVISPGLVDTQMSLLPGETRAERDARLQGAIPLGRVASAAEVARAVLWLASDEASFVVGHDMVIDGGASL